MRHPFPTETITIVNYNGTTLLLPLLLSIRSTITTISITVVNYNSTPLGTTLVTCVLLTVTIATLFQLLPFTIVHYYCQPFPATHYYCHYQHYLYSHQHQLESIAMENAWRFYDDISQYSQKCALNFVDICLLFSLCFLFHFFHFVYFFTSKMFFTFSHHLLAVSSGEEVSHPQMFH